MSTLILKSGNLLNAGIDSLEFSAYKNRVLADGGFIVNEQAVKDAFAFATAQKMTSSEVFSATSANWGVKLLGDKPTKLYSLFSDKGDIIISIGSASAIAYNTSSYAVPVIELKGSSSNALISKGTADNVLNTVICVVARAPLLSSNEDYGLATRYTLASLSDNTASSEPITKRILSVIFNKKVPTATDWVQGVYRYSITAGITTDSVLTDMTKWVSTSVFLNDGQATIYNNGAGIVSGLAALENPTPDNLSFNLGRERNTTGTGISFTNSLYGDIAEAWCLINTTADKAAALSVRGTQEYPRV